MAIKLIIQSVGNADVFKIKNKKTFNRFETYPRVYQLEKIATSTTEEDDYEILIRHIYNKNDILFDNCLINEVEVNGNIYNTYEELSDVLSKILFKKGGSTGSGGTGSLTASITSDVTEGGITVGRVFSAGTTNQQMWEALLNKTYYPTNVTNESYSISTGQSVREIGSTLNVTISGTFNRGSISGTNIAPIPKVGAAIEYLFNGVSTGTTPSRTINGYTVASSNNFNSSVSHGAGGQPKDNKGKDYESPAPANVLSAFTSFDGIYPYFYGTLNDNQTIDDINLSTFTKVVASSTGNISIPYSGVVGKKLVILIPSLSNVKTKWFVNALNNGTIGNLGDLFPSVVTRNYDSPNSLWTNQSFKVYVSTTTSLDNTIQLQN